MQGLVQTLRGKKRDKKLQRRDHSEKETLIVAMAYFCLHESIEDRMRRKEEDGKGGSRDIEAMPVSVVKDSKSKFVIVDMVGRKGTEQGYGWGISVWGLHSQV